ncbi:MAG: DUF5615 family PIN-like protein [Pirellulales bacterium]
MSVALYMDVHVPSAVSECLRLRGVDVLTAQDDGTTRMPDPQLLDRATELGRVIVTQDQDFLVEGAARQAAGVEFRGIVYVHQKRFSIGEFVRELELIGLASEPEDLQNRVQHLPL